LTNKQEKQTKITRVETSAAPACFSWTVNFYQQFVGSIACSKFDGPMAFCASQTLSALCVLSWHGLLHIIFNAVVVARHPVRGEVLPVPLTAKR